MDRLKSLRSRNYQQLRNCHPENHNHDDGLHFNDTMSFITDDRDRQVVVSIDNDNKRATSRIRRVYGTDDYESTLADRRASRLPITNGMASLQKNDDIVKNVAVCVKEEDGDQVPVEPDKQVVQGIWRECSYDFLGDNEIDSWEKKAGAERKDRRGTSFDFGVQVDPPSRLIGNFLQMQKEKGGNALDMDLNMELEALELPQWPAETVIGGRGLPPLSETFDYIKSVSEASSPPSARFPRLNSATAYPLSSPSTSSSCSASQFTSMNENGVTADACKTQLSDSAFMPPPSLPTIKLQEPVRPVSSDKPLHGDYDSPSGCGRDGASSGGLRARRPSSTSKGLESISSGEEIIKSPTIRILPTTFSRLKSRLAEPPIPRENAPARSGLLTGSGNRAPRSGQLKSQHLPRRSQQLRSGLIGRTGFLGKVEEEEEDPFKDVDLPEKFKGNKRRWIVCLEWIALILLAGTLVSSTVIPRLRDHVQLWGLQLWKWVTLVLVIVCGRLVSDWIIRIVVFFVERNFLLRKRVLYFVYALRRGVQNCMWLGFVLLAWHLMFRTRAQETTTILVYVTRILQCFLLAAALVVVKTFLVKVLASGFHVGTYFERIRDSLFNQYVVETLSGPPLLEIQQSVDDQQALEDEVADLRKAGASAPGLINLQTDHGRKSTRKSTGNSGRKSGKVQTDDGLTIEKLHKFNQRNISAWNMKRLINLVKHTGVATLTHGVDGYGSNQDVAEETEITSEYEAKVAAKAIFKNVVKPGCKYIVEDDLLRFMGEDEVARALPLFDGAVETRKITPQVLKTYVINVYRERRALALSLSDTKTAVNKLHRIVNVVLTVVVIVIWSLILGIATSQLLVFLSSQLLLAVFVFGNTLKTVFEAIIFLFVMHPFDVGDRCVIDGTQMVVEEMNILTTVFLGDFGAKLWYPNSVLATKPIQNFYRSPDMGDSFDFVVHASTSAEKIAQLKERIGKYIASKPQHWKPTFSMLVLDVVEMNKMKLSLGLSHTMNHQDMGEKVTRRSDLLWEMRRLFEELEIEYHLPTQEVHVRNLDDRNRTVY